MNDLLCDYPFTLKIGSKKVKTTQDMLSMAQSYMILEEKLNIWFNNPSLVDTNYSLPSEKELHR